MNRTLRHRPLTRVSEAEHGTLKGQIEQLKTSLEHAQLQRKRKLDYDAIAEKVNILPSRDDLEQYEAT